MQRRPATRLVLTTSEAEQEWEGLAHPTAPPPIAVHLPPTAAAVSPPDPLPRALLQHSLDCDPGSAPRLECGSSQRGRDTPSGLHPDAADAAAAAAGLRAWVTRRCQRRGRTPCSRCGTQVCAGTASTGNGSKATGDSQAGSARTTAARQRDSEAADYDMRARGLPAGDSGPRHGSARRHGARLGGRGAHATRGQAARASRYSTHGRIPRSPVSMLATP